MMTIRPEDMARADQLDPPDFVTTAEGEAYCRHCGIVKEALASFFTDHARECVEPRRKERDGL